MRLKEANEAEYEDPKDRKEKMDKLKEEKRAELKGEDERYNTDEEAKTSEHTDRYHEFCHLIREKLLCLRTKDFGKDRYRRRYYAFQSIRGLVVEPYERCRDDEVGETGDTNEDDNDDDDGSDSMSEQSGGGDGRDGADDTAVNVDSGGTASTSPATVGITGSGAPPTTDTPADASKPAPAQPTLAAMDTQGDVGVPKLAGAATSEVTVGADSEAAGKSDASAARALSVGKQEPKKEPPTLEYVTEPENPPPAEWMRFTSVDQLNELIEALSERGVRERELRSTLQVFYKIIESRIHIPKTPHRKVKVGKPKITVVDQIIRSAKNDILKLEQKLNDGALCNIEDREGWGSHVEATTTPQEMSTCILELEAAVESRYFLLPEEEAGNDTDDEEPLTHFYLGKPGSAELETPLQTPVKEPPKPAPTEGDLASGLSQSLKPAKKSNLELWQETTAKCQSFAQVFICLGIMEQSVDWSKSVLRAKCKTCKKSGDAEKLLLCDKCDKGYHMYCLKPPLKRVPRGDWFCESCSKRMSAKEKRKREKDKERGKEHVDEGAAADTATAGGKKKKAKMAEKAHADDAPTKKSKKEFSAKGKRKRVSGAGSDNGSEADAEIVVTSKGKKEAKKAGRPKSAKSTRSCVYLLGVYVCTVYEKNTHLSSQNSLRLPVYRKIVLCFGLGVHSTPILPPASCCLLAFHACAAPAYPQARIRSRR